MNGKCIRYGNAQRAPNSLNNLIRTLSHIQLWLSILDSLFYALQTWLNCSLSLPFSLSFFIACCSLCMMIHSLLTLHICFYDPHQFDESIRGVQIKCNEYCQQWKKIQRFPAWIGKQSWNNCNYVKHFVCALWQLSWADELPGLTDLLAMKGSLMNSSLHCYWLMLFIKLSHISWA